MILPRTLLLSAALILSAVCIGVAVLFVLQGPEATPADKAAAMPDTTTMANSASAIDSSWAASAAPPGGSSFINEEASSPAAGADVFAAEEQPVQPWEGAINRILESNMENFQVAAQLMVLAPSLPPDGQVEAAQHMVNLTDDQNYQGAATMLLNAATSDDVVEVIFSDVLNRPNSVKLPVMVSILRTPGNRLRDETLSTLQIFLGQDLGDDPEAWNTAVQNFLVREAQEEAAAAAAEAEEVQQ